MGGTTEGRYRGGMTTLARYGREHYSRISTGRPKRLRLNKDGTVKGSPSEGVKPGRPRGGFGQTRRSKGRRRRMTPTPTRFG